MYRSIEKDKASILRNLLVLLGRKGEIPSESNSYYVDKTMTLDEYLSKPSDTVLHFARPRRFGKTLTMTMFRDFLDIRQDSKEIFKGLKIMECQDIVDNYMNQYPVVFLSLKEVYGDSFKKVFRNFQISISSLCESMKNSLTLRNSWISFPMQLQNQKM